MKKSHEILRKKSEAVDPLRESIEEDTEIAGESMQRTITNEEGKEIKVFEDPLYSREKRSTVNYSIFRGRWEFENIDEIDGFEDNCAVRFYPVKDNSSFIIAFKTVKDRIEFFDSIYSDSKMKQRGSGMNLENLANSRVLQTTGGLISLSVLGYGLYRIFRKKE
jgi:hypothetical protein